MEDARFLARRGLVPQAKLDTFGPEDQIPEPSDDRSPYERRILRRTENGLQVGNYNVTQWLEDHPEHFYSDQTTTSAETEPRGGNVSTTRVTARVFSDSVEINIPTAPGPSFINSAEEASKGIVIYPNPTSGKAIMLDGYSGFFEIIDASGRVQQTGSVQKNEAIPLTLKPGIYFFKPIGYSQTKVVRFIVE